MANTDRSYSPADICAIFNIAKSTLFRWEQDGFVDRIPRDLRDRRVYKKSHLGSIAKHLFREQYQAAARNENRDSLAQLHESMALMKVIAGDPMGLRELAEFPALSTPTMRELCLLYTSPSPRDS